MRWFECIKNLSGVHRHAGGVYHYKIGQVVLETDLVRQGLRPSTEYFKQIERKNNGTL